MDCSLPGSFIHGISQVRIPRWVAISFSRLSTWGVVNFFRTAQESASDSSLPLKQNWESLQLLCYLCCCSLPDKSALFFCSCKIIVIKTGSRSSIVTRLRSQNGLGLKWLLFCQKLYLVFFSRDPLPHLLTQGRGLIKKVAQRSLFRVWSRKDHLALVSQVFSNTPHLCGE